MKTLGEDEVAKPKCVCVKPVSNVVDVNATEGDANAVD